VGCKNKQRLLAGYNEAVSEWGNAIQRLKEQAGIDSNDYMILEKIADGWRLKTQMARAAYTKHVEVHDCYTGQARSKP
jgi:hypothetical protein